MMRNPRMQDPEHPKVRPANDNWLSKNGAPTAWRRQPRHAVMRLALIISGLALVSCLLGIGTVELVLHWT
jgi:hypothetical protein